MKPPIRLSALKAGLLAAAALLPAAPAAAEPAVKVIYFTASWCSNCKVLTPRLDEAMAVFGPTEAELVRVDLTHMRGGELADRKAVMRAAEDTLLAHEARYLWDWYGGYTGLAAIIAADTGEPLACVMRVMTPDEIGARIAEGIYAAHTLPPGARKPQGPDCPAPTRTE